MTDLVTDLAAVFLNVTVGHDMCAAEGNDSGGECGVTTARRFIMPGAPLGSTSSNSPAGNHASESNPPFWYSFDYGSVHFVMLSTEHDITPGSAQYKVGSKCKISMHTIDCCIFGIQMQLLRCTAERVL